MVKIITITGNYCDLGLIELENNKSILWNNLTDENLPELPLGTKIEIAIEFDTNDFLSGENRIVWATYEMRQAEIIGNSLFAQNISSEIEKTKIGSSEIYLIRLNKDDDINEAINFIWKSESGLRLKPDWSYPKLEKNKSFESWLNGY
ncbi:MAG: hypothetical protein AUK34_02305 [Ignavibacteria bacterium CG2_30_36_16]|nr:hypothetical protein [Ignavibacteria bacterium]OIP63095.1 MAG: hypothetical protein AUK34_02305 [Ignavibacteria bacterium CG2_30_36_16]PJA99275.1 MAG: hypothetical protein CO127_10980 [Ignavibacteria bacterium CG_4_9_14_3_um_filter_36_18]